MKVVLLQLLLSSVFVMDQIQMPAKSFGENYLAASLKTYFVRSQCESQDKELRHLLHEYEDAKISVLPKDAKHEIYFTILEKRKNLIERIHLTILGTEDESPRNIAEEFKELVNEAEKLLI